MNNLVRRCHLRSRLYDRSDHGKVLFEKYCKVIKIFIIMNYTFLYNQSEIKLYRKMFFFRVLERSISSS